jgi:hypothetical protein
MSHPRWVWRLIGRPSAGRVTESAPGSRGMRRGSHGSAPERRRVRRWDARRWGGERDGAHRASRKARRGVTGGGRWDEEVCLRPDDRPAARVSSHLGPLSGPECELTGLGPCGAVTSCAFHDPVMPPVTSAHVSRERSDPFAFRPSSPVRNCRGCRADLTKPGPDRHRWHPARLEAHRSSSVHLHPGPSPRGAWIDRLGRRLLVMRQAVVGDLLPGDGGADPLAAFRADAGVALHRPEPDRDELGVE